MGLTYGSGGSKKFITNVGLITSNGPHGQNVMSCEWTHHISHSPGLIAVCIEPDDATAENIKKTKQFGVNICATDQPVLASISGRYSGKEYDKVGALKKLGFTFYRGKKIDALMIEGAALNVECKLYKEIELGDHVMFVGEAVEVVVNPQEPISYHAGKYGSINHDIPKPSEEQREEMRGTVEKFRKS